MKRILKHPVAIAVAMAVGGTLGGCFDSGSSDSATPDTSITASVGTFVDSPVDGLTFKGHFNGKTENGGKYNFAPGQMVSFYIGDRIKLGQLLGSVEDVSPLDFFGPDATLDQRILNILVLLQSLDIDGDANNGISITEESIALFETALVDAGIDLDALDFSTMTPAEADAFIAQLITILNTVVAETESPDDEVVSEQEAEYHFDNVMSGDITVHKNISRTPGEGSGGQSITSMMIHTDKTTAAGTVDNTVQVRPLLVSYTDTIVGDFLMGTGSSELPDIEHYADTFVALSLDKGETWKPINISNTVDNSSIQVDYYGDGVQHDYYGHSFKPAIKTEGNKVLVAWNDKFCPSGNPSNLTDPDTEDLYLVNGPQGTINYEGVETYEGEVVPAHEVPFSCVWTARGVFDEENHEIVWHTPQQLTSGRRDANKVTIASDTTGFVVAWQEDPIGLRPGSGAGPGEGWSGASTNHKTDIWYSYIALEDEQGNDIFAAVDDSAEIGGDPTVEETNKPKSLYQLSYPVPVTDNAVCQAENVADGTGALYCANLCDTNGVYEDDPNSTYDDRDVGKCYSGYVEPMSALYNASNPNIPVVNQVLNGDTGASRPVLGIWGDNVILGYEETKGAAETLPGVPNSETLDSIAVEDQGKVAYVHSFKMTSPETIAPGTIVNELKLQEATEEITDPQMVLENVRRLTMISQVDSTEASEDNHLWGILYKSGIQTQGDSSDMYLRLAKGGYDVSNLNTAADMEAIMDPLGEVETPWPSHSWNLSSRVADPATTDESTATEVVPGVWSPENLDDNTYDNSYENTFSPRGYLSGDTVFIGYEYTPSWRIATAGHSPNNFNVIRSFDNGATWQSPIDISNITDSVTSTVDPRLVHTSEAIPGLETRDPNTVFVTYGTLELGTGLELDLFVTRSTDNGTTWDKVPANIDGSDINEAIVQSVAEEKEVQNIASPDGSSLYSIWLQELDPEEAAESTPDYLLGSDIWAQRKDYTDE